MKTVSTLCATSTVIGLAAVGYSLGRPQTRLPTRPTSQKRKVPLEDLEADERGSPLTDPHSSASPLHISSHTGASVSAEYVSTTAGRIRRKTSAGWEGLKRLSDIRLDNTPNLDIEARGLERKGSVSSGKAWLHRLSGVSTSRNPSPSPSPGPDSRSISFSNGSTAPMLQQQHVVTETSQLPTEPNVLVKRSSSQRISLGTASNPMASRHSRVPSLRRPATSHQRSATMHQNFMIEAFQPSPPRSAPSHGDSPAFDSSRSMPSAAADTDIQWRRYFEPRSLKFFKHGPLPQGNVSSVRPMDSAIRRIAPEGRYRPTLLRATSISSACKDEDGTSGMSVTPQDESYVVGSSRPATPSGLHLLFAPSEDLESFPTPTSDGDRPPTRRSPSISDTFGSSPSFRSNPSRASRTGKGGRISLSAGRRYSSAPFPTPTHSPPVSAHEARAPVRRDITDGSLFARQTQTSHCSQSQSQSPSPFASPASPASPDSSAWSDVNSSEMGMGMGMGISSHDITPRHRHWQGHSGPGRSSLGASFPSTPPVAATVRTHRSSPAAHSERASTLVDSDNELRGPPIAASDEMDFESDTMFDSLRTGATGSSSGGRPLRIETMFDESPPPKTSTGRLHVGHTILPMSYHVTGSGDVTHDIPEENESISTPRKLPDVPDSDTHGTDVHMTSPHSSSRHALSLGKLSWDAHGPLESMPTWSMEEDEEEEDWSKMEEDTAIENHLSSPQSARVVQVYAPACHDGVRMAAPVNWQMSTPSTSTSVSVDRRGSRSAGRRTLDTVHLRSQSVPAIADPDSQRERGAAASKFGTWGLGSKAVSEDWNEDFEFDGLDVSAGDDAGHGGAHDGGSRSMFVPAAIQERQAQVIGHLGHVKEFAQLVEELKHLRGLARSRRIVTGPLAELWKEADGIIDLATLDDDRQELPFPNSPSSSAFDAFDEEPVPAPLHDRHRRKSVLGLDDDIFGGAAMIEHDPDHDDRVSEVWSPSLSNWSVSPQPADRQSVSAVARSVVETMHQRRTSSDPILSNTSPTKQSKMPFDTTTLRDLVAHVNVLSQKLAEDVRKSEGNTIMPSASVSASASPKSGPVPSLEQVLAGSAASSPSFGKGRAQRRKNSNGAMGGSRTGKENDMSGPLPMMAFV